MAKKKKPKPKWKSETQIPGLFKNRDWFFYRPPAADLAPGEKPTKIALRTKDRGEALQLIEELQAKGFTEAIAGAAEMLIEPYLIAKRHSGEHTGKPTEDATRGALEIFAGRFKKPLKQITQADLEKWQGEMFDKKLAAATIKTYMARAKAFMGWMKTEGMIVSNPFDKVKRIRKINRRRGRFCTAELRDKILESCVDPDRLDLRALLFFGFWACMRLNEALNVRPAWFELDAKTQRPTYIVIQDETESKDSQPFKIKGREGWKIMPVAARLADFLIDEYDLLGKIDRAEPYVIKPEKAQGVSRYRWQPKRSWATLMRENDCEWVTIHTMRHTFITLALSTPGGPTPQHIAQWTGTAVETIMENYAHLIDGGNSLIDLID